MSKSLPTEPPEAYPLRWYVEAAEEEIDDEVLRLVAWKILSRENLRSVVEVDADQKDLLDYIVAACNGYPVLLEAVREISGMPDFACGGIARAALDKIGGGS